MGAVIYAFGYNGFGQLGDGTLANAAHPQSRWSMPAGVNGVAVAARTRPQNLAIGTNHKLYAWGYNGLRPARQRQHGWTTSILTPVNMPAGVNATAIAGRARSSSYAIGSDGNLYAWGYNGLGELGNGTTPRTR